MKYDLQVDPEHFDYLRIQKGNLDRHAAHFEDWLPFYQADIRRQFEDIAPHLPATCGRFLDVGSGLGGIDVLIGRHYRERGQDPRVCLLDGVDDPPVMTLHRQTFNHARIARNFQVKNGTPPLNLEHYDPRELERATGRGLFLEPFDLIVSFGAWCFHLAPSLYLPAIASSGIHAGTVAVLEVRRGKADWLRELETVFERVEVTQSRPKWWRIVFRVKPAIAARLEQ